VINSIKSLSSQFVFYLLKYINLSDLDKSTTIPGLNRESVYSQKILLPPFNEQYRIVGKIEELFSEIDHIEANLYDIKKRLDVYWKGMLNAVYDKNYHNVELGEVSNITMGQSPPGTTYNDKGMGIPLVNGPVEFGKTSFSKTVLSKWTTKPTKTCKEGDIIICVRGSTTGRLNIAGFDTCIGRGVAAIEAKQNVLSKYLLYYLHHKEKYVLEMGTGTTFPSISKEQLYGLVIPLYTIEEQIDIVENFDCKYSVIENSKNSIDTNIIQIQVLKQSILNRAFEGELVPQDPSDEPASELLKKIKAERIELAQNKPKEKKVKINIKKMERTKSVLDLLKEAQKPVSAKEVWQQSKHWESIDDFYAELKSISDSIEQTKSEIEILLSLKK
jgi:type I restriction enzyme S subunit